MEFKKTLIVVFVFIVHSLQVYLSEGIRFRTRLIRSRVRNVRYTYTDNSDYNDNEATLSTGAVVSIVIGSLIGAGFLVLLLCCCCAAASSKKPGKIIVKQTTDPAINSTQMSSINVAANDFQNQQQPVMTYPYMKLQPNNANYSSLPPEYNEVCNYYSQRKEKE